MASNIEYGNTPHRRKTVPLPSRLDESSSSESECSVGHPPASSSRLRVDFRDMSPESSETSPDRDTSRRGRRALEEGHRCNSYSRRSEQRSRHGGHQDKKTLKSWCIRYSGEEKDTPEHFLSRLKACKHATGIPVEELLPCLASVLVKEVGDLFELYQEEIRTWNFWAFERAFKRQFVGELHEDDIMEELRARYQGLKE